MEENKNLDKQSEVTVEENTTENKKQDEKKKKKKRPLVGILKFIILLILIAAAFVGVKKGSAYVMHKQDPEYNNLVRLKYQEISNFDYNVTQNIVALLDQVGLGETGNKIAAKVLWPIMETLHTNEEVPVAENEEVNNLMMGTYTLEDEEYLLQYVGRKVKLTGVITQIIGENTARFIPSIEYHSTDIDLPWQQQLVIETGYLQDRSLLYTNAVVEIEGLLAVDPWDFTNEGGILRGYVYVNQMKEADYLALGGDPSQMYLHQKSDVNIHVEESGLIIDVVSAIVDAKTGYATVSYEISGETEGNAQRIEVVMIKGERFADAGVGYIPGDVRYNTAILNEERWGREIIDENNLADMLGGSGDVISLFFVCRDEIIAGDGEVVDYSTVTINHIVRVDIPSSEWTIYE